jgi:hypothetical protein
MRAKEESERDYLDNVIILKGFLWEKGGMVKEKRQEHMLIYRKNDVISELLVGAFDPKFLHF